MITFILVISCSICCAFSGDIAVLSQVNSSQLERGLIHFRSLWQYNPTETAEGDRMFAHACVSGINTSHFHLYEKKYANIGVVLHLLHDSSPFLKNKSISSSLETEWLNLVCAAQMADYYFLRNKLLMRVLFVSVNFLIVADLRTTLLGRLSLLSATLLDTIYCMPKQINLDRGEPIGGMCEMDLLLLPSRLGTEFYGVLNSTKPLDLSASGALEVAARSVSGGISFLRPRSTLSHRGEVIIRDGRMWSGPERDDSGIALVEFLNNFHRLEVMECQVYVNFEFTNHFLTGNILSVIFSRDLSFFQEICDDTPLFTKESERIDLEDDTPHALLNEPAVFDLIIFNDEIELLLLRLAFLEPHVTSHIIIESDTTFAGDSKPLHFFNNRHLFVEYNVTSFLVNLNTTGYVNDKDVWNREYFSRNRLFDALELVGARDEDIILVSDVDEIPHPRSLQTLVALHSHSSSSSQGRPSDSHASVHSNAYQQRIHKFHQQTYMYDFDCYLPREGQTLSLTALTATTLGYAKQLFSADNYNSLMTSVRVHQQHTVPYAYEEVLEPGGWHLTFFGGVQRIKSKLTSYSHRNILRSFVTDEEGAKLDDYGVESEKFFSLISEKILNGNQIDGREKEKCVRKSSFDEETVNLIDMWRTIALKMQQLELK